MISRRNSTLALASIALAATFSVANVQAQDAPKVKLSTSMGDIVVQLDPAKAPKTVENFLAYVNDKHYDGTVFHRVIDGFMIQGGGFTADMQQKPTKAPIPLEANNGLKNDKYTIAMARTGNPNSATSQFFINVKDNAMLNAPNPDGHGYAVFGKVIEGTAVVDKYVGTWVACAPGDAGGFERDTLALNKSGATTMVFSETRFNFPSPDCTGNGTQVGGTVTGSFSFVGTKTISGQTVDKIDITTTGSGTLTRQVIVIAADAQLHFGLTSTVDASGYPDALDSVGWVRQ